MGIHALVSIRGLVMFDNLRKARDEKILARLGSVEGHMIDLELQVNEFGRILAQREAIEQGKTARAKKKSNDKK